MLTVGGLFSGVGGWELGLERAGMRVLWHCEADPYARRVLERHWPDVPCYPDVRDLRGADVDPVDVLAGGFPCQDLSVAGKGAGLDGDRSGLWSEYARLVGELRPRYVLVENVSALLARGIGRVLGDLAALGYDAEWDCIPASAVGAPHQRDRVWLVAYPQRDELRQQPGRRSGPCGAGAPLVADHGATRALADAAGDGRGAWRPWRSAGDGADGEDVAPAGVADADREPVVGAPVSWAQRDPWAVEPDVGRVADGVPARVDRLRALGNALVPQLSEWIGYRILEYEGGVT